MAVNSFVIERTVARATDRPLFLAAAAFFPLIVLIGYFKSYYFIGFFPDARPIANALVHAHGLIMSAWVIYFVVQVALIRTRSVKLHMALGLAGIALAVLVVAVGLATAYDAMLVRRSAPPGTDPHAFFLLPVSDMLIFVGLFAAAIYYRKRPAEHKGLMLLTAINFMPAAIFRIPGIPPEHTLTVAFASPAILAAGCLVWHSLRHRRVNRVFAIATALLVAAVPLRIVVMESQIWLRLVALIAP